MNYLLNYLWEGSITLVLLYGFYRIFLTTHTFFGWNRIYLILSMGMALIIPLLSFGPVFSRDSTFLSTDLIYYLPEFVFIPPSENSLISLSTISQIIIFIYFIGVMVTSLRFLMGLYHIFQQIRSADKYSHQGHPISVNPEFKPSSFFHYIFLPEYNPTDPDHQLIISHEGLHSAYYHSIDTLFFQFIKIIFWFHPILKMVEGSLFEIHEYQVDKEITKSNSKTEYVHLLVNLIMAERGQQLVNKFNQFQIKKRIMMMDRTKSNLMEKTRFLLAIPLMVLLVAVFSCEQQEEAVPAPPPPPVPGEVFDVVENMPSPPGGMEGWNEYLSRNLTYPSQARERGIEGTVYLSFVVNADGSLRDVEILRGIGAGCDEEAMKTIKNSPKWEPGRQRDQKVDVKMRMPIRFALDK